jgi:flagellar hook protein FlgE
VNYNGQEKFTRSGAFTRDNDGYIVDTNTGAFVQGYNVSTNNGKVERTSDGQNILDRTMSNLCIPKNTASLPRQTQEMNMIGNLNAEAAPGYDSTRKSSMTIYDETGAARTLTFTFQKTDVENEWLLGLELDGVNQGSGTEGDIALDPLDPANVLPAFGRVAFNPDGTFAALTPANPDAARPFTLNLAGGSLVDANGNVDKFPKDVNIQLADPNNVSQGLKQYAADSNANFEAQDGFTLGELEDMNVDSRGRLLGTFTNGQTEILGQIAMARFANNEGLVRSGNNYFTNSPNSGDPVIGTAVEIFPTTLMVGRSLEQSNVDLTAQFTDMISTQRAFEAASRTVTVSDTLLQEINQLKR